MRLDQAVAARHPDISRRKARDLIAAGRVLVNDRPLRVASREVSERDRITVSEELPEIEVIRETSEWVAVNKPAGMATQPVRDRSRRSMEELLRVRYREIFLVHRIDTNTSGVVVFARTRRAAADLSSLFATRAMKKTYLAVAEGEITQDLVIETPIEGKTALTHVRPLRLLGGNTFLEAQILTGRTHQIRIHLQSIGHPVVGDARYGASTRAPRMMLHSWKLEHEYFGSELVAPPPGDFPPL